MSRTLMHAAVAALLLSGLALAACGETKPKGPPPLAAATDPAAPAGTTFQIPTGLEGVPAIEVTVIEAGNGPLASKGRTAIYHMRLQAEKATKPLIDSWETGAPRDTITGLGRVEPGLDLVLVRMRTGDRWKATLPPQVMFAGHAGPNLPANSVMNAEIHISDVRR